MRSCMRLGGRRLLRDRVNLEAFAGDVAGVGDDGGAFGEAGEDFDAVAEVAADGEGLEVDGVVGLDEGDEGAAGADDEGIAGDDEGRVIAGAVEFDLAVHAGEECAVGVEDVEFDQEGGWRGQESSQCGRRFR